MIILILDLASAVDSTVDDADVDSDLVAEIGRYDGRYDIIDGMHDRRRLCG